MGRHEGEGARTLVRACLSKVILNEATCDGKEALLARGALSGSIARRRTRRQVRLVRLSWPVATTTLLKPQLAYPLVEVRTRDEVANLQWRLVTTGTPRLKVSYNNDDDWNL
eukprot:TRINITY_DN4_c0_g1_i15.p3 TRINITY_DN4_c0_g1~~TRINITY_DN4_c0_g1_i15.p3  ORF type:complete len:112 (-),score=17.08 TRINITY_DN4_c0_g1_i15:1096-1431(-)